MLILGCVYLLGVCGLLGCSSGIGGFEKSHVDASSLKQLKGVPLSSSDNLIKRLSTLDGITVTSTKDGGEEGTDCVWSCTYGIVDGYPQGDVAYAISVYGNQKNAKKAFSAAVGYPEQEINTNKVALRTISDNIVVRLYPAFRYRNADLFYSYDSKRWLFTDVRIGNAVVGFTEISTDPNTIGTDTNKALAQIVEVLLPDAKTP